MGSIAASESDEVLLFSESLSRFVVEVRPADAGAFRECFENDLPVFQLGKTCAEPRLRIAGRQGEWLVWAGLPDLKEAWQKPLRW
jgi:phosphoribosylformylglycinamidine synthase